MRLKEKRKLASDVAPDVDSGMSFSDFLRYLIIAALILALVVFLGRQLFSMSKEMT